MWNNRVFAWNHSMSRSSIQFIELDKPVIVTLKTKCPEKYILVDRETGDVYVAKETGDWQLIRGGPNRNE